MPRTGRVSRKSTKNQVGTTHRRNRTASPLLLLRSHARTGSTSQGAQAVLRKGICVPGGRRAHVVAIAHRLVQAVVAAWLWLLVAPGLVVLGVEVGLVELLVSVKLAGRHAVQSGTLRRVPVGARRARRLPLVVGGIHGVCGVVRRKELASKGENRAEEGRVLGSRFSTSIAKTRRAEDSRSQTVPGVRNESGRRHTNEPKQGRR